VKGVSVVFVLRASKDGRRQARALQVGNLRGAGKVTAAEARAMGYVMGDGGKGDGGKGAAKGPPAKGAAKGKAPIGWAGDWPPDRGHGQAKGKDKGKGKGQEKGQGKGQGKAGWAAGPGDGWGGGWDAGWDAGWQGGPEASWGAGWDAGWDSSWAAGGWQAGSQEAKGGSWGKGGSGPGPGPGSNQSGEGAQLIGEVTRLDFAGSRRGFMSCEQMRSEVPFDVGELPVCLRARPPESMQAAIPVGTKLLFTLGHSALDGSPEAKDVMIFPNPEETFFGHVRSYSSTSGYGFIAPSQESSTFTRDLYFACAELPKDAGEDLARMRLNGTSVSFRIEFVRDGKARAKGLQLLSMPQGSPEEEVATPTGRVLTGTVKNFKASSGYGFITCPALGKDIWYARRELPPDCSLRALAGSEVVFELWSTKDGMCRARSIGALDGSWGTGGEGSGGGTKRPADGPDSSVGDAAAGGCVGDGPPDAKQPRL